MGFISNFSFIFSVATLLKLGHAGKNKKGQQQKCLKISYYGEAQNYFSFTKARDMDLN